MICRLLRYTYPAVLARAMISDLSGPAEPGELLERAKKAGAAESELTIEQRLDRYFHRFGHRIARSLPSKGGDLVRVYLSRSEYENLKLLCRRIAGDRREDPSQLLMPVGKSRFPFRRLSEAETWPKLIESMPKGPERKLVRKSLNAPAERRLFRIETGLDRLFWENVRAHLFRLSPFDRAAAQEILGKRADLERYRVIRRGLLPGLGAREVLEALPEMGTAFPPTRVRKALTSGEPEATLKEDPLVAGIELPFGENAEARILKSLRKELWKTLRAPPFDISAPLSALLLKELETRDLRAVLTGRLLNLDMDRVSLHLSRAEV